MGFSTAAARAGEQAERLAERLAQVRGRREAADAAALEARLVDLIRRRQAPELVEELRKAVR